MGAQGTKYLADALKQNKVGIISLDLSHIHLLLLTQSLTTCNLLDNGIGTEGAQYLADALKQNKVTHHPA